MYEGKGGLVSNYNSLDNVPNWRRIGCQDPGHDNRALMPRSSSVPSLEEMPKPDREKIGALTNGNGAMLNVRNQKFNRLDKVYAEKGRLSLRYLERVRQNDLEMLPKSVQHALYMRRQEDQDDTVQVVKEAMSRDAKEDFRSFKAPYNANRHQFAKPFDDTALRWKVIKALSRDDQGFGTAHDLVQSSASGWSQIGTALDGVRLPTVKRCALNSVRTNSSPLDRAVFWGSVGPRQQPNEHYRCVNFPLDKSVRWPHRETALMRRTFH